MTVIVLAGPEVIGAGAVDGLRELAGRCNLPVVNSWGAKGLFDWQDPHHAGTVGLQARDFELAGFADADLIVATGVDTEETPPERWQLGPEVWEVDPIDLASLDLPRQASLTRPPLFDVLAAVCMPQYTSEARPPPPGRLIADLRATMRPGDVVAADPGPAGLWVARAFPTSELGSVVVPARVRAGFAGDAALEGARSGRRVIGVTAGPVDAATRTIVESARRDGLEIELQVWGQGGLDVDWSWTDRLVEAAGDVVAWT